MHSMRISVVQFATAILLAVLVYRAWWPTMHRSAISSENPSGEAASVAETLEARLFALEAKALVGAEWYLNSRKELLSALPPEVLKNVQTFESKLIENPATPMHTAEPLAVVVEKLIVADHFEKEQLRTTYREALIALLPTLSPSLQESARILASIVDQPTRTISEEQRHALSSLVSDRWFIALLGGDRAQHGTLSEEVLSGARIAFGKVVGLLWGGIVLGAMSLICFLVFAVQFFRGKLRSHFHPTSVADYLLLEVFLLYLIGMMALPYLLYWLKGLGLQADPLISTNIGIMLLVILLAWPVVNGARFSDLKKSVGLSLSSPFAALREVALAPFAYLASWVILGVLLVAFSALLQKLGVNVTSGTHPVIPILISAENPRRIYLVVALAVLVAPFVEEIMFRGVLYGWLRKRLTALPAIVVSSLIFASIHPQGPVGIVPLSAIAITLGLIREWRGNILASMIAHACFNGGTLLLVLLTLR